MSEMTSNVLIVISVVFPCSRSWLGVWCDDK